MTTRADGNPWPASRGTTPFSPPKPLYLVGSDDFSNWLDHSLLELEEQYREFWTPRSLVVDLLFSMTHR